jgi:hypothetical protein
MLEYIAESTTQTLRTRIYDITGFEGQSIFWLSWSITGFKTVKKPSVNSK